VVKTKQNLAEVEERLGYTKEKVDYCEFCRKEICEHIIGHDCIENPKHKNQQVSQDN